MTMALFDCSCDAASGHARALTYETAHGSFRTPLFMPVGTSATVKGVMPSQRRDLGAQVVLANTYHLSQRPGAELVAAAGGIHSFMAYDGPMLTDSGGFQILSLADTRKLDDDGVSFRSSYDGAKVRWTPEDNMRIQELIGADIAMQLDQCPPYPATREFVARAVDLSSAWAARCLAAHQRPDQTLFGIVQGGMHLDLRLESIRRLREIEDESLAAGHRRFGGFGIGNRIARSAVQQTVKARTRAVGQITLFQKKGLESSHGKVAQHARTGGPAADDDNIPFLSRIFGYIPHRQIPCIMPASF